MGGLEFSRACLLGRLMVDDQDTLGDLLRPTLPLLGSPAVVLPAPPPDDS
jgi:hypothetical protein